MNEYIRINTYATNPENVESYLLSKVVVIEHSSSDKSLSTG